MTTPEKPMKKHYSRNDLSIAMIEELKRKGLSQSEIARMFNVTRQAVSWHKQHYGGSMTPREIAGQNFPWQVPASMANTSPYKRMRDHGEYMATEGNGMNEDKLSRLRAWYRKLRQENVVLEFDPHIPPMPGVSSKGGFAYRPRVSEDDDLLIRVNEYTDLTDEGRLFWVLPRQGP